MGKYRYNVSNPQITKADAEAVYEAVRAGMISHQGGFVQELKREFSPGNLGVPVNSGTNALFITLKTLGIGPGDEVIVPEFTMIASAYAVSYTGATPVFVDCKGIGDEKVLTMDTALIERAITSRTKAIMAVHIYGRLADMAEIDRLADKHNLFLVEDCAEVSPSYVPVGIAGCFSLFANKIITSGEGGIIVTSDGGVATQAEYYAGMAFDKEHSFYHAEIGHNFRMTNMQAALAVSQRRRLFEIEKKRAQIEAWYDKYLPPELLMPKRDWLWMYDILLSSEGEREGMVRELDELGIETRRFFKPMSMQKPYRRLGYEGLRAFDFSRKGLYLPTYTDLKEEDVRSISKDVETALSKVRQRKGS